MSKNIKMAIRYHGGKWMLGPWIISHFPEHRVYVEPFGGGASVLLRKSRAYAEIYSDVNHDVVSFFEVLRNTPLDLERVVRLTPFAEEEFRLAHFENREKLEQARRLVVRSFMGRGSDSTGRPSGFRSDSNRSGSTPAHDWKRWPDRIDALADRLAGVTIMSRDAIEVIQKFDGPDTLHFIDPPYLDVTRRSVGAYVNEFATEKEHRALAACVKSAEGMVVLCGYPSSLYDELYEDWTKFECDAYADGAKPRTECLWLNQAAASALKKNDLPLFEGQP